MLLMVSQMHRHFLAGFEIVQVRMMSPALLRVMPVQRKIVQVKMVSSALLISKPLQKTLSQHSHFGIFE